MTEVNFCNMPSMPDLKVENLIEKYKNDESIAKFLPKIGEKLFCDHDYF